MRFLIVALLVAISYAQTEICGTTFDESECNDRNGCVWNGDCVEIKKDCLAAKTKEKCQQASSKDCHWDSTKCYHGPEPCFAADNVVTMENGDHVTINELKIADRIATRVENGEYVFSQVAFLKKKFVAPAIRIVTETSWVGLAWKHFIITQNGWQFAKNVKIGDEIRMESGEWEKVVDIEHYAELMYSVRTTDLKEEILVNGLYASENSDGDELLHRKVYNFLVFKVLCRSKYLATFGHHFERLTNGAMFSSVFITAILAARYFLGIDSKLFKQE